MKRYLSDSPGWYIFLFTKVYLATKLNSYASTYMIAIAMPIHMTKVLEFQGTSLLDPSLECGSNTSHDEKEQPMRL